MVAAQGPGSPPPVNGEPGYSLPSDRSSVTLPPSRPPRCLNIARVSFSSALPPVFKVRMASAVTNAPRIELPNRLVTQTLPRLSIPSPLPLQPVSNFSTLVGSAAGNRVTCLPKPLVTQIWSRWSMPRWNGPRNDLHGSALSLANNPALGPVPLGEVKQLTLRDTYGPYIAAGRDDDSLHQPKLAIERDAFRRRQWLAVLIEYSDRLTAVTAEPGIVVGVNGRAEGTSLHSAAREARGYRRKRTTIRGELGGIALPQRVLSLPTDCKVVTNPKIAFAVEHRLAACTIASAIELQRQHPGTRREVQVRHERNRTHGLTRRYRIELVQQHEQPLG